MDKLPPLSRSPFLSAPPSLIPGIMIGTSFCLTHQSPTLVCPFLGSVLSFHPAPYLPLTLVSPYPHPWTQPPAGQGRGCEGLSIKSKLPQPLGRRAGSLAEPLCLSHSPFSRPPDDVRVGMPLGGYPTCSPQCSVVLFIIKL